MSILPQNNINVNTNQQYSGLQNNQNYSSSGTKNTDLFKFNNEEILLAKQENAALIKEYNELRKLAEAQKTSGNNGSSTNAQDSSAEVIGGIFGAIGNVIGGSFKAAGKVLSGIFGAFAKSGSSSVSDSSSIADILNGVQTKKTNGKIIQLNKELQELRKSGADENQINQKRQELLSEIRKYRRNR